MHIRSVLKDTPVWDAIVDAWQQGAGLAGSSAGGMVLADPMVDSRGGAFTVGLGVIAPLAFVPHADTWSDEKLHRTQSLAPASIPVVGVPERTALLRAADGTWSASGAGRDPGVAGRSARRARLPAGGGGPHRLIRWSGPGLRPR